MNQSELTVKIALNSWEIAISRTSKFLESLSDEQLLKEIAPGKNRGIYVVGHLVAYHDAMNEILGLGERMHQELDAIFMQNPDSPDAAMPSPAELKQLWKDVHQTLSERFKELPVEAWFQRHEAMTDEDFAVEPTRNKLAVLINRTSHASYHFGQLRLLS